MRTLFRPLNWFWKHVVRWILLVIAAYLTIGLVASYIPVNDEVPSNQATDTLYVVSNGLHVDLIIPLEHMETLVQKGLRVESNTRYLGIGWGDEGFFLNTRTWDDFTVPVAAEALFWPTPSLMHVNVHAEKRSGWLPVEVTQAQLKVLVQEVTGQFVLKDGRVHMHAEPGYTANDDFYYAKDEYSCLFTCNTWINDLLKKAGLPAALWTPFDFGITSKYD